MKVINIDMQSFLKIIFFTFTLNLSFFLILMIGIQNSSTKRKVNLIINETVSIPIGFVLGISFISGSLMGSLYKIELKDKE